jgi:hypothetical protein
MKQLLLGAFLVSLTVMVAAQADYPFPRVGQEADQLKRATMRLAENALQDLVRSYNTSRNDIQHVMLAQEIDGAATVLVEMVRNRRPGWEVREVASQLTDLSRRAPSFGSQASLWRTVQNEIVDLNRALNMGFPGPGNPGPPERPIIGRVSWRGMVDDRVQLVIRGRSIETRTISGAPYPDGATSFTSPLPNVGVDVDATKLNGRGTVRVLQQPARANDFTAVIEIYDANSGAQEYRLDIVWR